MPNEIFRVGDAVRARRPITTTPYLFPMHTVGVVMLVEPRRLLVRFERALRYGNVENVEQNVNTFCLPREITHA
jgi:hypothetical protein